MQSTISFSSERSQLKSWEKRSSSFCGWWLILQGARPVPDCEITRRTIPRQNGLARETEIETIEGERTLYQGSTLHFQHLLNDRRELFDGGHHRTNAHFRRSIRRRAVDPIGRSYLRSSNENFSGMTTFDDIGKTKSSDKRINTSCSLIDRLTSVSFLLVHTFHSMISAG